MAGADEGRQRLALRRDERLLEGDALVARQDGLAEADQSVPVAHRRRNMGDLVAPGFALLDRAAEAFEGLEEEGLDIMGLKPARLGPLHLLADAEDARGVHGVVRQGAIFEQVRKASLSKAFSTTLVSRARTSG